MEENVLVFEKKNWNFCSCRAEIEKFIWGNSDKSIRKNPILLHFDDFIVLYFTLCSKGFLYNDGKMPAAEIKFFYYPQTDCKIFWI